MPDLKTRLSDLMIEFRSTAEDATGFARGIWSSSRRGDWRPEGSSLDAFQECAS
jgi:hypothetical protein